MVNSLFVLCVRGDGNFSYRLYETLSAGRIPIIINTDLKLPLENLLNWKKHSIVIEKDDIKNLHLIIQRFVDIINIHDTCTSNRTIWKEYFSPYGFIKNFNLYFEKND
jgi:hypothetical protein